MTGLADIGIQVRSVLRPEDSAAVRALLQELEASLTILLKTGREHSIDLRSLPLQPGEIICLREALGEGEVRIDIQALGASRVVETAYRGIWWVSHHNSQDDLLAEFIEVSFCPDIVRAQRDDVRESLHQLSTRFRP